MAAKLIVQKEFNTGGHDYSLGEAVDESVYLVEWTDEGLANRLKHGYVSWERPEVVAADTAPSEDELAARRKALGGKTVSEPPPKVPSGRELRAGSLETTDAEGLKLICNQHNIAYQNKKQAIEAILNAEFPPEKP